jgi:hypothetical protein
MQGHLLEQSFNGLDILTERGVVKILPEAVRHLHEAG